MPDTERRAELRVALDACATCWNEFYNNVAMIADDDGNLSDEQVEAVIAHFDVRHLSHV